MNMKRICTVVFLIGAVCIFKNLPVKILIDITILTLIIMVFSLLGVGI